ncbi:hypothetical protein BN14_02799 [Rhizoctonia solani AG-1 IB]|uniref:Uncharacterized protein n=1 Tax=Thanatephorus cucumeris (strain AG1-IB / isolate 7/3/14) TaxID=1108050 RepID=M5BP35_THACB|nr:hypothetical protein BN14_02799 [Rhizoctonia solani AG-1 IB]
MRGGSADIDSVATSSPRESTHIRASSTTGLLYDPSDPFGDHPSQSTGSTSSRSHPVAATKALEARYRGPDQHVYPPSAYRGPESGTNEYHPTFFFRFRESRSIRGLAKPFTHLDIPALTLEDKPNHEIGINDVGHLISPNSPEFFFLRGPELAEREAEDSVVDDSDESASSNSPSQSATIKSRYAVRISVSGLDEYPQPFFSHKIISPQEKPRIEREIAAWKGAYEVLGSSVAPPGPEVPYKTQSIEELLQENFDVPRNTLVLPQKKQNKEAGREENSTTGTPEQPPQPTEYQLFKVHSRKGTRSASEDLSPDSHLSAEGIAESDSPATGMVMNDTPTTASSMQSAPRLTKRERQLEQMRLAVASQVRSITEKRRVEEEAVNSKAESEADQYVPPAKQQSSLWDRFLRR